MPKKNYLELQLIILECLIKNKICQWETNASSAGKITNQIVHVSHMKLKIPEIISMHNRKQLSLKQNQLNEIDLFYEKWKLN